MQPNGLHARQVCRHAVTSIRRPPAKVYLATPVARGIRLVRIWLSISRAWGLTNTHCMAQHGYALTVAQCGHSGMAGLCSQEGCSVHATPGAVQPAVEMQLQYNNDMDLLQLACKGSLSAHLSSNNNSEVQPGSVAVVHAALHAALRAADKLSKQSPAVDNAARLTRRIRSDLNFLERCIAAQKQQEQQQEQQQSEHDIQQEEREEAARQVRAHRLQEQEQAVSLQAGQVELLEARLQEVGNQVQDVQQTDPEKACYEKESQENASDCQQDSCCIQQDGTMAAHPVALAQQQGVTDGNAGIQDTSLHNGSGANDMPKSASNDSEGNQSASNGTKGNNLAQPVPCELQPGASHKKAARMPRALTEERLQGLVNNLRGYSGELLAAQAVPGLVAVCKRFHAIPCTSTPAPGSAHEAQVAARSKQQAERKRRQQQVSASIAASAAASTAASIAASSEAPAVMAQAAPAMAQAPVIARGAPVTAAMQAVEGEAPRVQLNGHAGIAPQAAALISSALDEGLVKGTGQAATRDKRAALATENSSSHDEDFDFTMSVEVDVVCQHGSVWLEVKNQEVFGLDSEHWHSSKGSMKGLQRQVQELLAVAAAPCNAIRWQAPHVAVLFPCGADAAIVEALKDMGVAVIQDLGALASLLPPRPPEPRITNLDTTTMCALVSQVSWALPADAAVARWAARASQWRQCVAQEAQCPLIPQLEPYLAPDRHLIAADVAVKQFEVLVEGFAGPQEKARWATLRARLEVVPTEPQASQLSQRVLGLGELREVGQQQVAVLGVGDARRAITLTANGAAIRSAERQGVCLEAVVHRAVWLTGM